MEAVRQTHRLQGLIYIDPPTPLLNKIRKLSKKTEDQVWFRDTTYEQWEWEDDWIDNCSDEQLKWYEEEVERLHIGAWIMINGIPTYFNKYCYFFHQHFVLQEGIYPTYKDTSLEYFRFYELCENDQNCVGDCGIKGRRVGLSSMSAAISLLIALLESNTTQGIVSKTGTDAQEMFLFVKNGLENLPNFLMPDLNKVTESEIHIAKPAKRISKNNTKASADKGKNNRIDYRDTSENAYDQSRKRKVTVDEAAKWFKVNVLIFLAKVMQTVMVGASVVGHISCFSSVNKGDAGGDNFRKIWDGSDHQNGTKDFLGRTQTKMKRFFIAGFRGFLGYVGKYGESVIDTPTPQQTEFLKTYIDPTTGKIACPNPYIGARQYHEENRKMFANDADLLGENIRMYPFKWEEVFHDTNTKCHFRNPQEINNQIERIKSRIELGGFYRRGWFTKQDPTNENEMPVFKDAENGMWYILDILKPHEANKQIWKNGQRTPNNTDYGGAGVDTFSNSESTAEKGSDAAMCVFKRYNILDPENSGMATALFIGRPSTKLQFHQQIFWGACFWGVKMLIERAPTDWYDYAEKQKLLGYCLKTTLKINGKDVFGCAPQDHEGREQHLTEMVEYIDANIEKLWFLRIAEDLIPFNVKDRTDFDGGMCFGYALMACKEKYRPIVAPEYEQTIVRVYNLLRDRYGRN